MGAQSVPSVIQIAITDMNKSFSQMEYANKELLNIIDKSKRAIAALESQVADLQRQINSANEPGDLSLTIAYEALLKDGVDRFISRMISGGNIESALLDDVTAFLNAGLKRRKPFSADMQLCRLLGYVRSMAELIGCLPDAGFSFKKDTESSEPHLICRLDTKSSKTERILTTKEQAKPSITDLDKLEGPAYEAALAKMTDAERAAHLNSN